MHLNKVTGFITLPGTSEEAINLYLKAFPDSELLSMTRFEEEKIGEIGKVMNAQLRIRDSILMFMDMKKDHAPEPSWIISLYINCETEAEFDQIFSGVSEIGQVMMGPGPILNLRKVAWVSDPFGITWQLVYA